MCSDLTVTQMGSCRARRAVQPPPNKAFRLAEAWPILSLYPGAGITLVLYKSHNAYYRLRDLMGIFHPFFSTTKMQQHAKDAQAWD